MTSNRMARGRQDAASSPAAGAINSAFEPVISAARDIRAFLRLLGRTLTSLPADVLAASIAINLLALALPLAILQVYDRIVPHAATATLTLLIVGVLLAVVLETLLRIARSFVIAWAGMKSAWAANVDAASRVALAPPALVDAQPAAQWIQRLNAVSTLSEFSISPWPLVLVDLVFGGIFVAVLIAGGGWLAAVPMTVFLFCAVVAIRRGRELRGATMGRARAEARMRDFLMEVMQGIVTVRALGAEQQILRRFERLAHEAVAHTQTVVRLADDAQSFASTVSTLTQIATATAGAVLAVRGEMSLGVVACSTMLAGRVIQPLLRLVSAWNEIQAVLVAEDMAKPIFALPRRGFEGAGVADKDRGPMALALDDVAFTYDQGRGPVLKGATLAVRTGEIIALTGSDGIGKSTVARLAAGQLTPAAGSVLLNGVDIGAALAGDRGAVAMVDGGNAIVRGSVLSNLTMYRDAERLEAALEAARLIGLQADINRMPRGYDTPLGGAASETLPTSLLRRIAIVRAMAGRPGLLILDEVNNGFDHASEIALSQGLLSLKGRVTIIIVTNRPSFAAIADRRFTLSDGTFQHIASASMQNKAISYTAGEVA